MYFAGPIEFSFDQDTYTVDENDGSVEVCVTPNRTIFCERRSISIILMIVFDIEVDTDASGSGMKAVYTFIVF